MNSRLKIPCVFILVLLICAIIMPVIAASEGSGITGWILTTQDIKRVFSGYEVNNGENQGNTLGFHAEGMYPWVNAYFSDSNEIQADYTIISNKWMAYSKNSAGVVKSIVIDYSVFSYWDSPTRDQVMQRITGSMPFHQKYGSSKSIQIGNAGRAYITPVYDSATGNVYHIEFSKGYVYATLNVQIPKDQTGETLSIRIAEELEKKIPIATTIPSPTPVRASFTLSPQSGVAPLTVTFTDASVGNPVARLWKFHDGQTFTSNNVRFTYNTPGSYMVYLTVTGSDGSTSTVTTTVKVLTPPTETPTLVTVKPVPPPVAGIYASTTTGDAPLMVQFGDHSSGSISTRLWNFGDGYRSEIPEPGHTFQKAGTYTVKLTVNGAGGSDTEILVINVGGPTIGPTVTSQVTTPITPRPSRTEVPVTPTVTATTVNTGKGDTGDTGTKVADSTVAAVVAVVGAAAAAGVAAGVVAGAIPGAGGRPPCSSQDLQDEYRRLLDTIATEKANRNAWAREGKDSGRDGMISTLEEEAERRRKELEELGAIPDYEGRVEGPVGPSDMDKDLGNLEQKAGNIESTTSEIMEQDQKGQSAIDNLFRLRKENYDATSNSNYYHTVMDDGFEKTIRQLATGKNYDGKVTRTSWWLGMGGRVGSGILTGGKSELAIFPAQLTYNALDYVEKNPNASELGMYGQMAGETTMYGLTMYGGSAVSKYLGQAVEMNTPLLRETFPNLATAKDVLSTDVKDLLPASAKSTLPPPSGEIPLLPGELPPQSGLRPLVPDNIAAAADDAFRNDANALIREAEELKLSGTQDTTKVMDLAARIRKNDIAVTELNANKDLKFIAEANGKVETQAMDEFSTKMGGKVGTDPSNIVMKKWTGRSTDQLGRDFDGTAYEYVPESNELPPHLKLNPDDPLGSPVRNNEYIKQLTPEGRLVEGGNYYKDFKTGEIKEVVPGKYYEPAVKVSEQQQIFNESLHKAAGSPTDVTPDKLAEDLNIKVTTRMSNDSYGYQPEQTGRAIAYKVQEPSASSFANSHHEATKLIKNLNLKIESKGIDPATIPHYNSIQMADSIIKANAGSPVATENALRAVGISTTELGNMVGDAYFWLGKVKS